MDFFLELALYGSPLPLLGACIIWLLWFSLSQQKGERTTRKWRDMDHARQIIVLLVVALICFTLYLALGDELSALNVSPLPLSSAIYEYHPVMIWSLAASILGLTYMISIRFPRRTILTYRQHYHRDPTMSDTSTDDAILQQVPNIAGLLGLKQFTPKKLMWQDSLYMGRGGRIPIPVDYVFVGPRAMILAQRMQSVLTPEEWRPLIGSTLLMRAWTRPRLVRMITIGIIAALAYYIPISILFFYTNILGPAGIFLESPLGFIVALVAFALYGRSTSPQAHQEALRADVEVARVVGRDVFLSTLQKIDSMGFNEVAKLDRKPSRFKKPSIQERIQNLQSSGILPPSQ